MSAKTATITLEYPVQLADKMLDKVEIRRPNMGDLLDYPLENTGLEGELRLVAHLSGLTLEDLRLMDGEDYGKLQLQLLSFRRGDRKAHPRSGVTAQ